MGGSPQEGGSSIVPIAIALVLVIVAAVCLFAPNKVDNAIGQTVSAVSDKNAATSKIWTSVTSTFTGDEAEDARIATPAARSGATVLTHGEKIVTGEARRTVLTRGNDILELEPQTAIAVGDTELDSPASIIELIYGTLHVKAAKRTDGETLSIETEYLVATVKGTQFDVTMTEHGAAVSVTEGLVSVRSTRSREGLDVTPGHTAIVSAVHGAMPTIIATPAGGALAAVEAAVAGTISNGNHHKR
jgi:hypothetical protein